MPVTGLRICFAYIYNPVPEVMRHTCVTPIQLAAAGWATMLLQYSCQDNQKLPLMGHHIETLPLHPVVPGYQARFVHGKQTTLAYWEVEEGASMPMHAHPHEQMSQVLEGSFELTVGGSCNIYGPGVVIEIPSNVVHGGRALTRCRLLDVFTPVREDYKL